MIAGFPMVAGLLLPGVAGEPVPGGEVAPDGFGAVLAAAFGSGAVPEVVAVERPEPETDATNASVAMVPVVAVLPDPVVVPVPVAVQPGDTPVPDRTEQRGAGVPARPDRGEAAALLRVGMVAASLPARVVPRVAGEAAAQDVPVAGAPVGRRAVGPDVPQASVQDNEPLPVPEAVAALLLALPAVLEDVVAPIAALAAPLERKVAPLPVQTSSALPARVGDTVPVAAVVVLRGLPEVEIVAVEGPRADVEEILSPVTLAKPLLALPVTAPEDVAPVRFAGVAVEAPQFRVVPPVVAAVVDVPRRDAGQRDDTNTAVATSREIVLPVQRLRGDLPDVLTVLQGSNGPQRESEGHSAPREAVVEMVAPLGSAVVLPGVSGGNAVVRGLSETVPAVALPEAAPVLSVDSVALGPVAIGVEGGEQDLRVSLSGSNAAAATMSAEAPRLLAELAANGVRVQSLAFEGRNEPAADAAGPGGFGAGPGHQGASQSGSERGRAGIAAGLMRLPDAPPARSKISERYA